MDARDIIGLLIGAGLLDVRTGAVNLSKLTKGGVDNERGQQDNGAGGGDAGRSGH